MAAIGERYLSSGMAEAVVCEQGEATDGPTILMIACEARIPNAKMLNGSKAGFERAPCLLGFKSRR